MDEAVEWAKRCPNPMPTDSELEIRPIWEDADFAEVIGEEGGQREQKLRKLIEAKATARK